MKKFKKFIAVVLCFTFMVTMVSSVNPVNFYAAEDYGVYFKTPGLNEWDQDGPEDLLLTDETITSTSPAAITSPAAFTLSGFDMMSAAPFTGTGYGSNGKFLTPIEPPDPNAKKIYTPQDLDDIRNDLSGSYVLMNDIDLSTFNGGEWKPIGGYGAFEHFKGTFDGQGYVIANLTITQPFYYIGLFGSVNNAIIKNVGLENTNININNEFVLNAGGICGEYSNNNTETSYIDNCYNNGDIIIIANIGTKIGGICVSVKLCDAYRKTSKKSYYNNIQRFIRLLCPYIFPEA